jgi:hypothetical protein
MPFFQYKEEVMAASLDILFLPDEFICDHCIWRNVAEIVEKKLCIHNFLMLQLF